MVTMDNIKRILECSDMYEKLIRWANGDEKALVDLINQKLKEKEERATIVEVLMAIIEKYYLYRPDGTEEIKVEKMSLI